jgi:hypothetical protein
MFDHLGPMPKISFRKKPVNYQAYFTFLLMAIIVYTLTWSIQSGSSTVAAPIDQAQVLVSAETVDQNIVSGSTNLSIFSMQIETNVAGVALKSLNIQAQGIYRAEFLEDLKLSHNVTWAIATTDEGKLFGAFRTRFSAVALKYIPKKDIAKIVKLANPTWEMDVCELVAHYNARIPRKALEFARLMQMYHGRYPEDDWAAIAKKVATNEGIDDYGMGELQLMVLKALGQGPIAKARMPIITGREEEEVEKNIMPWLLSETEDQPAYVTVGPRGFYITQDGLNELNKRNIANKGVEVLCS